MIVYEKRVPNVGEVVGEESYPHVEWSVNGATALTIDCSGGNVTIWYRNIRDEKSPADIMAFLVGVACGYGCTLHNLDFM